MPQTLILSKRLNIGTVNSTQEENCVQSDPTNQMKKDSYNHFNAFPQSPP